MAISREEIEQIAAEVAKRVVTPEALCRCGYNTMSAVASWESTRRAIDNKDRKSAEEELEKFKQDINDVEQTCWVSLDPVFNSLGDTSKSIAAADWPMAADYMLKAMIIIEDTLRQTAKLP